MTPRSLAIGLGILGQVLRIFFRRVEQAKLKTPIRV